jgi:hypothetical protein
MLSPAGIRQNINKNIYNIYMDGAIVYVKQKGRTTSLNNIRELAFPLILLVYQN